MYVYMLIAAWRIVAVSVACVPECEVWSFLQALVLNSWSGVIVVNQIGSSKKCDLSHNYSKIYFHERWGSKKNELVVESFSL